MGEMMKIDKKKLIAGILALVIAACSYVVTEYLREEPMVSGDGLTVQFIDVGQALSVKQALSKMADAAAEKAKKHGIQGRTLVISHCNCPDRATYVRNLLFKKLPFTRAEIVRTGGISTVYAGDGGVVVAF